MDKLLWNLLVRVWARKAAVDYGEPRENGELFNTASFQTVVEQTTGSSIGARTTDRWLANAGYHAGPGNANWYPSKSAADKAWERAYKLF